MVNSLNCSLLSTAGGKAESGLIAGPMPAELLCSVPAGDHPGLHHCFAGLVGGGSSGEHWMWVLQTHVSWLEVDEGGQGLCLLSKLALPVVSHFGLDKSFVCLLTRWRLEDLERVRQTIHQGKVSHLLEPRF